MAEHQKNPAAELAIYGVEKTDETGRLCRLNLAVHGLEGDIRHGGNVNSYYDDPHEATGQFDFVLANPPFNVNAVDKERLKDMVGPGRRYPFGLPRTDNANYLWIQLFHSALNAKGRAGFVMANSASDARASEQEIRQQLIESRAVDVMVAVGPNMFYTVTLPCTLWFFDKGKAKTPRADTVLFIDARHIYRQVDRAHREWTPAQISFLANLVRLYRGEALDFTLGGDEAEAKLKEVFGKQAQIRRRSRPVPRRHAQRNRGAGLVAQPRPLRGRGAGRSRQRRGLQGAARNPERGTRNPERPGPRTRTDHRRQRGGDSGGVTMAVSWKTCTVHDLEAKGEVEIKTGPFGTQIKASEYVESGVPMINARNIGFRQMRADKLEHLSEETVRRLSSHLLRAGDIVFGRKGTVERHVLITKEQDGWFQGTDCLRLRMMSPSVDNNFLSYSFLLGEHQRWMMNQSSHGATMTSLNQDIIRRIPLRLPPLPVQQRIAGILSAYDELIENSRRRIKILESMGRALYREWFVHFHFPGHQDYSHLASSLSEIPNGWEVKKLRKCLSPHDGPIA